ncbi:MAG: hypothetical protein KKG35_03090 [Proteobacteria bacterium]|nr:hypothetical protein [Pseudomonadota bacterium]
MKKAIFSLLVLATFLLLQSVSFAVPNIITYQGKLNDQNGVPLTGSYSITFTIYDDPVAGTARWTETWDIGTSQVTVTDGLFQVELGSHVPLVSTIFDKDGLYLGIKVEFDAEMMPRQKFTSGSFAFRAEPLVPTLKNVVNLNSYSAPSGCDWHIVHTFSVPQGEIWEVSNMWAMRYTVGKYGRRIDAIRMVVEGVVHDTTDSYLSVKNDDLSYFSNVNSIYSPPLQILPGKTVVIEGYFAANRSGSICDGSTIGINNVGYYYQVKSF